jgi:hypothetical protein
VETGCREGQGSPRAVAPKKKKKRAYISISIDLESINITASPSLNKITYRNQYKPKRKHLNIITIYGLTEVKSVIKARLAKIPRRTQLERLT